jgi:hypothetical protein
VDIIIPISEIVARGEGWCEGGDRPDPPIDAYPLLVWVDGEVRTEDGKASVHDLVVAMVKTNSIDAVASRFDTTRDHVLQAMHYAETG